LLERSILWWAPRERIERMVRIDGLENLTKASGPVILLAPHFLGFDASISRLSLEFQMAGMYAPQKDLVADRYLYRGRGRFGARLMPREAGLKGALGAIKSGAFYFYLPDLDYGPKHSIFVPFFGVQAATVTGLSYLARASGAKILPCVTRMLPGGDGYVVTIYPAWSDYPGRADRAGRYADARRMLAFIEERVLEVPEQYYWLHKRFKTRPQGEPRFYP
jgi:KDO2-lipid IV(A) lauroyltransferase